MQIGENSLIWSLHCNLLKNGKFRALALRSMRYRRIWAFIQFRDFRLFFADIWCPCYYFRLKFVKTRSTSFSYSKFSIKKIETASKSLLEHFESRSQRVARRHYFSDFLPDLKLEWKVNSDHMSSASETRTFFVPTFLTSVRVFGFFLFIYFM